MSAEEEFFGRVIISRINTKVLHNEQKKAIKDRRKKALVDSFLF